MKRVLCLAMLLLFAPIALADDAADARKIIDKGLKATGRAANEPNKAITFKGKGTFYGMGDGIAYNGTWSLQYPDKRRMEIEGFATIVLNGNKGWMSVMGNVMDMNDEQLKTQKESIYAERVSELKMLVTDKGFTLATAGETKVEGKECVGVKVSHKDHSDVTLYFDKETGLLAKSEHMVKDEQTGGTE